MGCVMELQKPAGGPRHSLEWSEEEFLEETGLLSSGKPGVPG